MAQVLQNKQDFLVVVLQSTVKDVQGFTVRIYAHALFSSLNLFQIAIAITICLSSLLFTNNFNCSTTGVDLPNVYVEFFNRAPLKSRFCVPKALQKRTKLIFISEKFSKHHNTLKFEDNNS